jgi:anthranilate phosphoribosyltransferase
LSGRRARPLRDVVLLNSAASLIIAGRAGGCATGPNWRRNRSMAAAARQVLERLVAATNGQRPMS